MKTVIIPVAGKGTRLLPLTKVTPKALLPVFDQPVIQFAVDEAVAAGAERLVIVDQSEQSAMRAYFENDMNEITALRVKSKHELADAMERSGAPKDLEVVFAIQPEALGLGHAILCAAEYILDGPVGVILPDDVILGDPCLAEMDAAYVSGNMVAAMDVELDDVSSYGIFDISGLASLGTPIAAKGMVEKPAMEDAPSQLAAVGRYILTPEIFDVLKTIPKGAGGEFQLTDAISSMIADFGLTALKFSGVRFDCGNHAGLLAASNARYEIKIGEATFATAAE